MAIMSMQFLQKQKLLPLALFVGLVLGCSRGAVVRQTTTQSFDIAKDANASVLDRKAAISQLDVPERKELEAKLLARFPGKWDASTADDLIILAEIGGEDTAQKLEQMYSMAPNTGRFPQELHYSVATIRNRLKTHAFDIAADPYVYWGERTKATPRLDMRERKQLQAQLLARIPGKWDVTTMDDIGVLSEIGDEEAAQKLESIYMAPNYADVGKMTRTLRGAVENIRKRFAAATRDNLTQAD